MALAAGAFGGCLGGDDGQPPEGGLGGPLSFLPARTGAVLVLPTELESGPLKELDDLGSRREGWDELKRGLEAEIDRGGLDFDQVIRPQLGSPLVVGIGRPEHEIGALRLRDPASLREAVEGRIAAGQARRLEEFEGAFAWRENERDRPPGGLLSVLDEPGFFAIADEHLVIADTERDLSEALDAHESSENLASDEAITRELDRLGEDALFRVAGDAQRVLDEMDAAEAEELRRIRWIRALGNFSVVGDVATDDVAIRLELKTDRIRLSERDLPLPPGPEPARLHSPDAAAALGLREPDRLLRLVERVLAATDPNGYADYRAAVDQLRLSFGVDVHDDLVAQVTNLSVALSSGTAASFQARLRRGAGPRVRRTLSRAGLFIAELVREIAPGARVRPQRVNGERGYVVTRGSLPVARFAVTDDAIVGAVGFADLPEPTVGRRIEGTAGALVFKGDLTRLADLIGVEQILGESLRDLLAGLGDLTLSVRAETSGLSGNARLEVGEGG